MIKNKEIYFKLIFDTHAIFPVIKDKKNFIKLICLFIFT